MKNIKRFGRVMFVASLLLATTAMTATTIGNGQVSATGPGQGQETCPNTNFNPFFGGWVKYDNLHGKSFTYPAKTGFTATQVCWKAGTTVKYVGPANPVWSTAVNWRGHIQDLSHVSVYYQKDKVVQTKEETVYGDWTDGELDCEEGIVHTSREVWLVKYEREHHWQQWQEVDRQQQADETSTRPATEEELKTCEEPEVPEVPETPVVPQTPGQVLGTQVTAPSGGVGAGAGALAVSPAAFVGLGTSLMSVAYGVTRFRRLK